MKNYWNMNTLKNMGAMFKTFKKQKMIAVAILLICAAILATGTLAYFSGNETAYNVITTGSLSMDLVEETTGGKPWPKDGITGVLPGTEVDKIPYVVNTGEVEFYARMRLEMRVTGADGKPLSDEYISLNINTADWTEKDGYYYYNKILKPGEESKPLFTKVMFDINMNNAYMKAKTRIDVIAEAVQSKNNGASALEASGWSKSK